MIQFLVNAKQVLKQISQRNEAESLLKNNTWNFIDDKGDKIKYIFKDNGELQIEKKENILECKWEYSSSTYILKISKSVNLSFFILFIDKSAAVLQMDPEKPEFAYLVNIKYLQNKELEMYIRNAVAKTMNISLMHVTDGFELEIHRRHTEDSVGNKGQQVTRDLKPLADGMYQSSTSSFIYEVQDSVIVRKNLFFKITLSDGTAAGLYTENKVAFVSAGDKIVVNQKSLGNGKYYTQSSWFIIENEKVTKSGTLSKFKTDKGNLIIEQIEAKPVSGDLAYLEGGNPYEGTVSAGLFKKIKISGGKVV